MFVRTGIMYVCFGSQFLQGKQKLHIRKVHFFEHLSPAGLPVRKCGLISVTDVQNENRGF